MKGITWRWQSAILALIAIVPSFSLILMGQVSFGLVAAVGIAVTGTFPLPSARLQRLVRLPLIGVLVGGSLIAGSLLSHTPFIAVLALGLLTFSVFWLSTTHAAKLAAPLMIMPPITAIGLSFHDTAPALIFGAVIVASTIWMALLSLFLPVALPAPQSKVTPPAPQSVRTYAVVAGVTAGVAAAIPFVAGWQHVGWVAGSALLVLRPVWEVQKQRSIGRACSVAIGAIVAAVLLMFALPPFIVALLVASCVVVACGTSQSRWYITPGFLTFIVFFILLYDKTGGGVIIGRLEERIGEVLLGIALALIAAYIWKRVTAPRPVST